MESSIMCTGPTHNTIATQAAFSLRKFVWYVRKHCTITAWSTLCTVVYCSAGASLHNELNPARNFALFLGRTSVFFRVGRWDRHRASSYALVTVTEYVSNRCSRPIGGVTNLKLRVQLPIHAPVRPILFCFITQRMHEVGRGVNCIKQCHHCICTQITKSNPS